VRSTAADRGRGATRFVGEAAVHRRTRSRHGVRLPGDQAPRAGVAVPRADHQVVRAGLAAPIAWATEAAAVSRTRSHVPAILDAAALVVADEEVAEAIARRVP